MPRPLTPDEVNADTQILSSAPDVPAPSSQAPYDFEHGVPSETDLHDADILPEDPGGSTQTYEPPGGGMKAKVRQRLTDAQARAQAVKAEGGGHPDFADAPDTESELAQMSGGKPMSKATASPKAEMKLKSIDQLANEDAERILGRPPLKPPVAGTMEGQPVKPTTVKVPDAALGEVSPMTPQDELAALQQEVTSTAQKGASEVHNAADSDLATFARGRIGPQGSSRFAGRLAAQEARTAYEAPSLAEKAAGTFGSAATKASTFASEYPSIAGAGRFAKTLGKAVGSELISPFTGAAKGWSEGGNIVTKGLRGGWGLGKGLGKGVLEGAVLPSVIAGEGNVISDELTYGPDYTGNPSEDSLGRRNPGLVGAREEQVQNLKDYNATANKYGMKVTGTTNPLAMMLGKSTNIQVQDDPALKAAYQRQNKKRIQEMMEQQAVNPNVRTNSNQ